MTGNLEFDRLVSLLPQAKQCEKCGLLTPFARRIWAFKAGTTGAEMEICFWCSSPVACELALIPQSLLPGLLARVNAGMGNFR